MTPLRSIKDNFPKTVLTVNAEKPSMTKEGILIKDIVRWILNENE